MPGETQELLLRVFINEADKRGAVSLSQWIVEKAIEHGLSGATVLRGKQGFGVHGEIHGPSALRRRSNQPVIIEIVDGRAKIDSFMAVIDGEIPEGLAIVKEVDVRRYHSA